MRKCLIILMATLFMVACTSEINAVKDDEFTFSEEEFKEVYENLNDRNLPSNISASNLMINIDDANKEELKDFLKAAYELTGYKEISNLESSIKKDEDNIPPMINNKDISIVYDDRYENEYSITVYPNGEMFKEGD